LWTPVHAEAALLVGSTVMAMVLIMAMVLWVAVAVVLARCIGATIDRRGTLITAVPDVEQEPGAAARAA
jgi:hypothetical protein